MSLREKTPCRRLTLVCSIGIAGLLALGVTGCTRDNTMAPGSQNSAGSASYAGRLAMSGMSRTKTLQNPLERHKEIEAEINRLTGTRSSVVLQEGPRAYVAVADTAMHHSARLVTRGEVEKIVHSGIPTVTSVLFTQNKDSTLILEGYANALSTGTDMTRQMIAFHQSVSQIWPSGRS